MWLGTSLFLTMLWHPLTLHSVATALHRSECVGMRSLERKKIFFHLGMAYCVCMFVLTILYSKTIHLICYIFKGKGPSSRKRIIFGAWKNNFLRNFVVVIFCPEELAAPPLCLCARTNIITFFNWTRLIALWL